MPKCKDLITNYFSSPADRTAVYMEHLERNYIKICFPNNGIELNSDFMKGVEIDAYFSSFLTGITNLISGVSHVEYCLNEFYKHAIVRCWFEETLQISQPDATLGLPLRYVVPNTANPVDKKDSTPDCKFVIKDYVYHKFPLDFTAFDGVNMHNLEVKMVNTLGGFTTTTINFSADSEQNYQDGYLICLEHYYGQLDADSFIFNAPQVEL